MSRVTLLGLIVVVKKTLALLDSPLRIQKHCHLAVELAADAPHVLFLQRFLHAAVDAVEEATDIAKLLRHDHKRGVAVSCV